MKKLIPVFLFVCLLIGMLPIAAVPVLALTEGDWEYSVVNGEAAMVKKYNGLGGNVEIPSSLGGYPVNGIDVNAFMMCDTVTGVQIPETVMVVRGLSFNGCKSLINIDVNENNPSFKSVNGVLFSFDGSILVCCPAAKGGIYAIPEGVESIDSYAFSGCGNLTGITFCEGVTDIGNYAFVGCTKVSSIVIPSSVTRIGNGAFAQSSSLTSFTVSAGNQYYKSDDNVIFTKDGKTLVSYAGGKPNDHYTIPDGVVSIGHHAFPGGTDVLKSITLPESVTIIDVEAFRNCYGLTSITVPSRVTSIGVYAFDGCYNLETISIPGAVTTIERAAFNRCTALSDVYYGGSQEKWDAINIESENVPLTLANIHFDCRRITFDANGGSGEMATISVETGTSVALPQSSFTAPNGKEFDKWKLEKAGTYAVTADVTFAVGDIYTVSEDVTFKALWKDAPGANVTPGADVTPGGFIGGGTTPSSEKTKDETEKKEEPTKPEEPAPVGEPIDFPDVQETDWYAGAVDYVSARGIMKGLEDGSFGPEMKASRAMIAQLLFNLEGAEAGEITNAFGDVSPDDWYAAAVSWMVENGIARGEGETFGAENDVTREQLIVMLYNYAKFKGYDVSTQGDLSQFDDAGEVSDWAEEAMEWAVGVGLVNGMGDGTVAPGANANRAQIAVLMQRFCETVMK